MKLETFLNTILKINNDFYQSKETDTLYYEVLHASLSEVFRDFTENQYNKIPLITRKSVEKLEKEILSKTSKEYQTEYSEHISINGKFREEEPNKKTTIITQVKNKIGFI